MKFLLLILILNFSCNKTSFTGQSKEENKSSKSPFAGTWISDCLDFGGGTVNQIFVHVTDNLEDYQAMLTFSNANCTGTYTMTDVYGNSITEPTHQFDAYQETVEGIPEKFFVMKTTEVATNNFQYVLMYISSTGFDELVAFPQNHSQWGDWLLEADVSGFVANPSTYVPTIGMVLHFHSTTNLP